MSAVPARVHLRPDRTEDAATAAAWLAEAVALDGARPAPDAVLSPAAIQETVATRWPGAQLALVALAGGEPIGILVWREGTDREVTILALAVRAERRNLGYGGEAVIALEAAHPGRRFLAMLPRANGLGVYFWLRVGYRPLTPKEDAARARDPDFLWLRRAEPEEISGARPGP